jgi:hypothetical protein
MPELPERNYELSPFTGLTREHWAGYADYLLRSVHEHATESHANIYLPGPASAYGRASDSLEAFARTFLLASFRIAGDPQNSGWLAEWYAAGLDAGTNPASPERWPRPDELGQAKVEAASLAVGLALTREHLWDKLPQRVQEQLIAWFETVIGGDYPPINWVWFQIVVETFLASVGGRSSDEDIDAGLAVHDSLYKGGGWFADGPERAYDHYVGWAFQVYPQIWALMAPDDPRVSSRKAADAARLADFLDDAAHLVGANGAPLIQGRSLIYRFAAAAPFWAGELAGNTRLAPGLSRRAASGMLDYFTRNGGIDSKGLLPVGWFGEFPGMKQSYSGSGSPYWAAKGMMGLALPADHRVWTAIEEPLPVESGDTRRLITAPGWQVNGTAADGVVRIFNHGTDHARQGDTTTDSPLYARLGYSTHSFPDLAPESVDNAVVLVDGTGRMTHRTGFETLGLSESGGALIGASRWTANWITPPADSGPDHGSGVRGDVVAGAEITAVSVTHGPVEVRLVQLRHTESAGSAPTLRIGGWPLAPSSDLTSVVRPLQGFPGAPADGELETGTFAPYTPQPMGEGLRIPWLGTQGPAVDGVYAAVVGFGGDGTAEKVDAVRYVAGNGTDDGGARLDFGGGTSVRLSDLVRLGALTAHLAP